MFSASHNRHVSLCVPTIASRIANTRTTTKSRPKICAIVNSRAQILDLDFVIDLQTLFFRCGQIESGTLLRQMAVGHTVAIGSGVCVRSDPPDGWRLDSVDGHRECYHNRIICSMSEQCANVGNGSGCGQSKPTANATKKNRVPNART